MSSVLVFCYYDRLLEISNLKGVKTYFGSHFERFQSMCRRRALTETGHQSSREASLLGRLAVTQWTRVQRLSPENKGGLPCIPFRAGYRNGVWGGGQLVPYIVTCYFIGCFNLWGEGTLLWSPGNIPQLWFFFVSL
jgi:hypothetical protein